MQAVSDEFKELAKGNARISLAKFIIKDSNTEIDGETIIDGFIQEMTCDNTSLVGNVMAKNLETSIYNNFTNDFIGKEIYAYTGQQLEDGTEEFVPRGTFIIDESEEDVSSGTLKLKGLDYAIKFNKAWEDPLDWENNTYTLKEFAKAVCEFCDLELESEEFTNSDYVLTAQPAFEGYQCRYVMQKIAEIAVSNVFITNEDKVQIRLAPQNYVSVEGSSITLEESANSRLKISEFDGEITQEQTTQSANFCPPFNDSKFWTYNGGATANSDGSMTIPTNTGIGTPIGKVIVKWDKSRNLYVRYTKVTSGKSYFNTTYMKNDGTILGGNGAAENSDVGTIVYKPFGGTSQYGDMLSQADYIVIQFMYNATYSPDEFSIKDLIVSSSNIQYIPFVPDSPSPDYPQPIQVVSGRQEVEVCGKNYLDLSKCSFARCILNSDNSVTSNFTNYYYCQMTFTYLNDIILANKGNNICFSMNEAISDRRMSIVIWGTRTGGGTYQDISSQALGLRYISGTIANDWETISYVELRFNRTSGNAFTDTTTTRSDFQLEFNNSPTDFEPYKGNTYQIPLSTSNLQSADQLYQKMYAFNSNYVSQTTDGSIDVISFNNTQYRPDVTPAFTFLDSFKENTQYTFRCRAKREGSGGSLYFAIVYTDNTRTTAFVNSTSWLELRVVSSANKTISKVGFSYNTTATWYIDKSSWFIGEGAYTTYEPYRTPIWLGTINDYKDKIFRNTNLFNFRQTPTMQLGEVELKDNGVYIDFQGEEEGVGVQYTLNLTPNKPYRLICDLEKEEVSAPYLFLSRTGHNYYINDYGENAHVDITFTPTTNETTLSLFFDEEIGTHAKGSVKNIYIGEGEEFIPYGEYGEWYLHKEIGKVVLNGSENDWIQAAVSGKIYWYRQISDAISGTTLTNLYSNYFKPLYAYNTVNDFYLNNKNLVIFNHGIATTLADFKTWLSTHNTIVYYVLNTPTTTKITNTNYPELYSQLKAIEKIRSLDGITYIDVDSANLPLNLSLRYDRKDVEDIDINSIMSLEVEDISYRPYNAVTLALADGIEGENVTLRDESSIALYGERPLVITANEFAINQAVREELIQEMFNSINGFNYVPMKLEYNSYDWLERFDRIRVQYDDDKYYETYLFNHTTEFPATIKSTIEDVAINETKTKYEFIPETQQKNIHAEIAVDKLNGVITEVVSAQEEDHSALSELTVDVDGIRSRVELNYDFVRETNGNNYISVDDMQQEGLVELKIIGTAINNGYLRLHITNNIPEYIDLPITNIIYVDEYDYDTLSIESVYNEETQLYELHCFVIKKLTMLNGQIVTNSNSRNFITDEETYSLTTEDGQDLKLETFVSGKEDLGVIDLPIQSGQHTFSIVGFNDLNYYLKYTTINNVSNEYALRKHIVSEINQSAEQIQINADKVSLNGKKIELTSDNIEINSDNFKVDTEGKMTCTDATITGGNLKINSINEEPDILITNEGSENGEYAEMSITGGGFFIYDKNDGTNYARLDTYGSREYEIGPHSEFTLGGEFGDTITLDGLLGEIFCGTLNATDIYYENLYPSSLEEKKKNFEKFENGLDIVKDVDIYRYNYKTEEDGTKKHIGLVIGDNFKYREEVTSTNNKGADIYSMVGVLWKAVQEQQEQIENLKEELNNGKKN